MVLDLIGFGMKLFLSYCFLLSCNKSLCAIVIHIHPSLCKKKGNVCAETSSRKSHDDPSVSLYARDIIESSKDISLVVNFSYIAVKTVIYILLMVI